tara:strand:+ start:3511 stop:4962 length:1452 start_codon:yes stop_codon:yes gene_type:complete
MANKKNKTLSQISKKANSFNGKEGDTFNGNGYFPNKNLGEAEKISLKQKIDVMKSLNMKKFKSTFEEKHLEGRMSKVPEKMIKHKQDSETGTIKSNPKFINPENVMKFIEESNMKISRKQITDIIRSEIKDAVNELSSGVIQEKGRGKGGGLASPAGLAASAGLSKGGFSIQNRTGVAGDTEGGTRSSRAPSPSPGGSGGRGTVSSKGRASVASAISTAGASRLTDFQAAKTVGGRNATSGKISAGYIAKKSTAINKFNSIINSQITALTSARDQYSSGRVMYVALNNLINVLNARKTEYEKKWDYAQAIYDDNGSAKTTARNAIISARQTRRQAKPVGSDPPPPPPTPNHTSGTYLVPRDRSDARQWSDFFRSTWRTAQDFVNQYYANGTDGYAQALGKTGWASMTQVRSVTIDSLDGAAVYNKSLIGDAGTLGISADVDSFFDKIGEFYGNRRGEVKALAMQSLGVKVFDNNRFVWSIKPI